MKKIILISAIALLVMIATIFFLNQKSIVFKNLLGETVNELKNNSLPFTIESKGKIYVNGKEYDSSRIYEEGCYQVRSGLTFKKICINTPKEKNNYNFYISNSTLSTLYNSLIMSEKKDEYSYVWYGRKGTMDIEYLKKNPHIYVSNYVENQENTEEQLSNEIVEQMKKILEKDKNAYFNLYLEDEITKYEYLTVLNLGLNDNRYHAYYITNGTLSYVREYFHNSYDNYKNYEKIAMKEIADIRSGKEADPKNATLFLPIFAKRENVSYYLQYPNYFQSTNEQINQEYQNNHYIAESPKDLFTTLTEEQKDFLFQSLNFDKEQMTKDYFDSEKPILIITGNTPMDYNYGKVKFQNIIKEVTAQYGEQYKILFKPHPRALPDAEYQQFFKELHIDILPGMMPMEIISFSFDNLKLGGFTGSLYMSVNSEDVLFFFAKDSSELFKPLDNMCQKEFKNVIFMQP